ncbi:1-phosphofructokinase family hexose kinase [Herbiconiux liukaitaii]|uniref:1-phosphofructokinase family hexose kinase n=1 Tax=Herbiconiux liukaitaii TaxID=3342799 RepID=UPI0035BAC126
MIVTVTLNPSLDRTIELEDRLLRGQVQRAARITQQPGGKGVNVSRALHAAGVDTLAILPGAPTDPMIVALQADGIPAANLAVPGPVRSNTTITEPDGTTTKINEAGSALDEEEADALIRLIVEHARSASWLVLAGSLPPGVPDDLYARIVRTVRADRAAGEQLGERIGESLGESLGEPLRIAVDTSGAPLAALVASGETVDVIKPNAEELVELAEALGVLPSEPIGDPDLLTVDDERLARLADAVLSPALGAVLVTLGAEGAALFERDDVHTAPAPVIVARSTVGAGDCSLAGYLLAAESGEGAAGRLALAIAYGAAAASLPGSTVPTPDLTRPEAIHITRRSRVRSP